MVVLLGVGLPAVAQEQEPAKQEPPKTAEPPNDPFYRKPKPTVAPRDQDANKPVRVPFKPFAQRQEEYQRARQEARAKGLPDPNPIGQYLVSELTVTGVFQTESGVGAFIQAEPTKTTFFVTSGTRVYNGEIVSINTGSNFDQGLVTFRELTVYRIKKKEQNVVNTVTKAVRPAGQ